MTQVAPGRRRLDGWQLCATVPGRYEDPARVDSAQALSWISAPAGTVAAMLRAAGQWSLDGAARRFDAEDWWLRTTVHIERDQDPNTLHFGGLGGLADVWFNGEHLLRSENMHLAHDCALQGRWRIGANTVHVRISALDAALALRRPRPRWRAPMIEHQQLRWFRQALFGRTPGWTPPVPPLGLWRDAWIECGEGPPVRDVDLRAGVGEGGWVEIALTASDSMQRVELELQRGEQKHSVELQREATHPHRWQGRLRIDNPVLWWPHTHGEPALYGARLRLHGAHGEEPAWPLAPLGFRRLDVRNDDGGFALSVNGVPVFCRGACWMPLDLVSLTAAEAEYRTALTQVSDAGMNMLRVSGATVYEDEAFFAACDAAGVLVWQEFMFANMDYPGDDEAFAASVRLEAAQQLSRWASHPSLAVLCGNSEVEQQAAMWGAPREQWTPPLFHGLLRELCAARLPQVPYWPSSAHGGAFPHQADRGTTSYYGVGAYLRPTEDARRARPRFATECLGFSNVPEPAAIARMPQGATLKAHHPLWKSRAPRDLGAGWDFEDVRDHYLRELFGVDPLRCRYATHDRYLALSRLASGEAMAAVFAEWRRPGSGCNGGLVWFLRDLWAGAGWGLLDERGAPKACWWLLQRVLQPRALLLTDEGVNGLDAHLLNDSAEPIEGLLRVALYGPADALVADASRQLAVGGRGGRTVPLADLFDDFVDLSYSYRFGPPAATLVHARWLDAGGRSISEAFHFPDGRPSAQSHESRLEAHAEKLAGGGVLLRLRALRFVQALHIELDGWTLSDNHFHMAPGGAREVVAQPAPGMARQAQHGWLHALNAAAPVALRWDA